VRIEEPVAVLDGRDHVGIDNGSLGRSANGRAPLFGLGGTVTGQVSVGILEEQVSTQLKREILAVALYSALALAIGVVASWLLARTIKRATFGLELAEIVPLLHEREAMLHGIREGVVGVDAKGCVNVINDEARRLLGISATARGHKIDDFVPPGRLHDLLIGDTPGGDEVVLTDQFLSVVNRMPVVIAGRDVGYVITLRDPTELEGLVRELHAVTGLTTALRGLRNTSSATCCMSCRACSAWVSPRKPTATSQKSPITPQRRPTTCSRGSFHPSWLHCCSRR
jgi:two-component system CitB family sensor kinase